MILNCRTGLCWSCARILIAGFPRVSGCENRMLAWTGPSTPFPKSNKQSLVPPCTSFCAASPRGGGASAAKEGACVGRRRTKGLEGHERRRRAGGETKSRSALSPSRLLPVCHPTGRLLLKDGQGGFSEICTLQSSCQLLIAAVKEGGAIRYDTIHNFTIIFIFIVPCRTTFVTFGSGYVLSGYVPRRPGSNRTGYFRVSLLKMMSRACAEAANRNPCRLCSAHVANGAPEWILFTTRVCRDFAVLEDHTLAHSLQEQEIEHHLATNVQRNRLVQYDLQMAKQLQEEEDRKARARIQERHKDLERQDCEIAQEIQVKLVIEAEQRRRQEEDDEDIARILQQKELQEEKRRKKPHPEPLQKSTYDEGYYPESRGTKTRGAKDANYHKGRPAAPQDQELYDAEIARKLQEEELLASHVDKRAAQVAQDEEIARLLLAEEKKAYKKAKERGKSSLEKKRQEPDWKHDAHESVRPRSREGHEGHRSRSDKPTRPPPPPSEDLDQLCNLTSQQNVAHQTPRPEPSHKGYHYKQ
uniref:Coiled-coil domain containing 50 n=1 Tax=Podarcis muralis TaxID=64176 RepID=A0A670KJD2_PODMU